MGTFYDDRPVCFFVWKVKKWWKKKLLYICLVSLKSDEISCNFIDKIDTTMIWRERNPVRVHFIYFSSYVWIDKETKENYLKIDLWLRRDETMAKSVTFFERVLISEPSMWTKDDRLTSHISCESIKWKIHALQYFKRCFFFISFFL
jgi:hypothetical protein